MVRAFHAAAIGALVMAAVLLVLYKIVDPSRHVLPAVLAIVPMLVMIAVHARRGTWRSAALFLVVGGVCAWWFSLVVELQLGDVPSVASYLVSLAIIPLLLVGGAGSGAARVIAWSVLGFAVGRVATLVGTAQADGSYRPGVLAWVTLAMVVGIMGVGSRMTSRLQRIQPELLRSARDEHVSAYRQRTELEAAAILHDTVLSHLGALALAPDGPMDGTLAQKVDEDLATLSERDWLSTDRTAASTMHDAFGSMLTQHRDAGLDVTLSGDLAVLDRLGGEVLTAVTRATDQCLANVRKHAETDTAEVSVFDDGRSCTVMVVDDGRGFDERETGADRMGLRNSVRERVGRVGGEVQVWSAPGSGTSVMLTVPLDAPALPPTPEDDGMRRSGPTVVPERVDARDEERAS
jgi:signal transduction histidine kinase